MSIEHALAGKYSFMVDAKLALEKYNEYGFHIEPEMFSEAECEALIQGAYELQSAKNKDYKPAMMPHRENQALFLPPLKKSRLVDIIEAVVGGNPMGLQSTFFFCPPGTRGFSLHQDNFFLQTKFGVFTSAWIALVDTFPENGGLIVYPGTHKEGDLPVKKLNLAKDHNQDPNANNEETDVPEQYRAVNLCVRKGSVLFIHGHIVHGSNPNMNQTCRYVLLNTYIKEGEQFRRGNYAHREPIPLRN